MLLYKMELLLKETCGTLQCGIWGLLRFRGTGFIPQDMILRDRVSGRDSMSRVSSRKTVLRVFNGLRIWVSLGMRRLGRG